MEKFFLIDGSNLIFRAYFAFKNNPLTNSQGLNVSVIHATANIILNLMQSEEPDYLLIAFDTSAPTFRHELLPEYKANRKAMEDDMRYQIAPTKDLLKAMGVNLMEQEGFEADDIIGSLATGLRDKDIEAYILSSDKDFFQLVNEKVKLYRPQYRGSGYDIAGIDECKDKYGLAPNQIVDYLSLTGDNSDNVKGVPSVGPKTATKLLSEYGSIEGIYENLGNIKSKRIAQNLEENRETAFLAQKLITIKTDMKIGDSLSIFQPSSPDYEKINKITGEFELSQIFKRISDVLGKPDQKTDEIVQNYSTVENIEALKNIAEKILAGKEFAFDLESTSLDVITAELTGIGIGIKPGEAYYIPLGHRDAKNLEMSNVFDVLKPIFENADILKIGHNLKYDISLLKKYNIEAFNIFDTMIATYLIDPNSNTLSLDELALSQFNYRMKSFKEVAGIFPDFSYVSINEATFYTCEDADFALRLRNTLLPIIEASDLEDIFYNVELPLVHVLKDIELRGVSLDKEILKDLSVQINTELDTLRDKIFKAAGEEFNLNSPKQLSNILFTKLGIKPIKKTKTGLSTDAAVLNILAKDYEIADWLIHHRELTKLKTGYVDALPKLINPITKKIHTSFNQTIAATGRLSSSNPNLQNVPIRTPLGREIRKAFVPSSENHVLLSADYSQIELRVLAHLSGDENLIKAFVNDEDIHSTTASIMFDIAMDEVTADLRSKAKTINFGVLYGMGSRKLSRDFKVSIKEADEFISNYFDRFPSIKTFIDNIIEKAKQDGYSQTLLGRKRPIPQLRSSNGRIYSMGERIALNSPIQGSAADIIKVAMINLDKKLKNYKSGMILQVHDELVLDVFKDELEEVKTIVAYEMSNAVKLKVPLKISMGTGKDWKEAH